jgi:ferric-dicitrate binding protein FerR (iron transport regulator)
MRSTTLNLAATPLSEKHMSEKDQRTLIVRYLSGECSEAEAQRLHSLMQEDRQLRELVLAMQKVWNVTPLPHDQVDLDGAWQQLYSRMRSAEAKKKQAAVRPAKHSWFMPWPALVRRSLQFALVLLFINGAFFIYDSTREKSVVQQASFRTVRVENGQRLDINLPDGSHIKLDAGSELRFPAEFTDAREVFLTGEAYFEVTHDAERPFKVHANHAMIRVLGTKFNIRAWQENPVVAVTVSEGSVALNNSYRQNENSVIIRKGYYSSLAEAGLPSTPAPVDVAANLGWMHNEIHFKDASVNEVLAQLKRWYDFTFDIEDPAILEHRITVHIRMTNIEDVLELISILTDCKISKDGKAIKMTAKH